MDRLPSEQEFLLAVKSVVLALLCLKLVWTRLYRSYSHLFAYLVAELLRPLALSVVPIQSVAYFRLWITGEFLIAILLILMVFEAYSKLLRGFAGIETVARRYTSGGLGLAILASVSLMALEKTPATVPQYLTVCDRVVLSSLVFFVLLSTLFLAYYPVPLSRNVISYSIGFAIYLPVKAAALFLGGMRMASWYRETNTALLAAGTACLLFWLAALNPGGEIKTAAVHRQWEPEDEKRILARLQAINDSLLRATKK